MSSDGEKRKGAAAARGWTAQVWTGFAALAFLAVLHLAMVTLQQKYLRQSRRNIGSVSRTLPLSLDAPAAPAFFKEAVQAEVEETESANAAAILKPKRELVDWINQVATLQEVAAVQELRLWLERSRATTKITHQLEKEARQEGWANCGIESELCQCASGVVRYGDPDKNVWTETKGKKSLTCNTQAFGGKDVAPGKVKSCQCLHKGAECPDGQPVQAELCPGNGEAPCRRGCAREKGLPKPTSPPPKRRDMCGNERPYELLWSCDRSVSRRPVTSHRHNESQEVLDWAVQSLCADQELSPLMEVYLDCEFVDNYRRWTTDDSEWLEEAYVTYVAGAKDSKYEWQATNLVRSVHLFSSRPIVVLVYDDIFVPPLEWRGLPGVIVYRMRPIVRKASFNFNKLRAMIAIRAVSGIQLDTDQIIFTGMDQVFNSTTREISRTYPWPIMPVHWMSRDDYPNQPYKAYVFRLYTDKHTMRWNHAHPTWTFWAVPFLCDTLQERLIAGLPGGGSFDVWKLQDSTSGGLLPVLRNGAASKSKRAVKYKGWMIEDEDMLNVNLWRDGVSKAWCKFDVEPGLFTQRFGIEKKMYADPQWYPDGVPLLFISSHNTKGFEATDWLLNLLSHCAGRLPKLRCPSSKENNLPVCKVGSTGEREARQKPSAYTSQACCCVEPRWAQPIFWHGKWYSKMSDVPEIAPGGSGQKRRCVMP